LWSRGVTITALVVAICSPVLGALADRGGFRKRFVLVTTIVCVAGTTALFWVEPGQVMAALVLVVIANIAFEFATVFYNAFLPDVSTERNIGAVSGWGWGLGYIGGLLALAIALFLFVLADPPWFGLSTTDGENIRATNLLVAGWFLVFSVPFFILVREPRRAALPVNRAVPAAFGQLADTFRQIKRHKATAKFLLARLIYNDGLVTIFAFGGIYAAGTFGFSVIEVLVFGIALNLTAGLGSIAMGYLDDRIGARRTIIISLYGLILAALIAVFATGKPGLWVAGIVLGIFVGPNQSSSRSLMGRLAPAELRAEFFGFFALSGKLTAFIGPFLLGIVTGVTGSQRAGLAVVLAMFIAGLVLMAAVPPVRESPIEPA
jgi:UMF1 family MFS transporter